MKIETFEGNLENDTHLVTFRAITIQTIYPSQITKRTAVRINKSFKHNIHIKKPSNLSSSRSRPDVFLMVNRRAYLSIFPKMKKY